jgi:hypothetical protein
MNKREANGKRLKGRIPGFTKQHSPILTQQQLASSYRAAAATVVAFSAAALDSHRLPGSAVVLLQQHLLLPFPARGCCAYDLLMFFSGKKIKNELIQPPMLAPIRHIGCNEVIFTKEKSCRS